MAKAQTKTATTKAPKAAAAPKEVKAKVAKTTPAATSAEVKEVKLPKEAKQSKFDLKETEIEKLAKDFRTREIQIAEKETQLRKIAKSNPSVNQDLDSLGARKKTRLEELKEIYITNKELMEERFHERELELERRQKHEEAAEEQVEQARQEVSKAIALKDVEVAKTKVALDELTKQVSKLKNDLFILTAEVDSKDAEYYILRDARKSNAKVEIDAAEKNLVALKRQQSDLNILLTEKTGQQRFAQDKYDWTVKEFENRVRDKENILELAQESLSEIRKHADLESTIDVIAHDRESLEALPSVFNRSERIKSVQEKTLGDEHKTVSIVLDDRFIKSKQLNTNKVQMPHQSQSFVYQPENHIEDVTPPTHSDIQPMSSSVNPALEAKLRQQQSSFAPQQRVEAPAKKSKGLLIAVIMLSALIVIAAVAVTLGFLVFNWF